MIREIKENELNDLLELYTHLHESGVPENSDHLQKTWESIYSDENHHIIVCEVGGKIVSSCVCDYPKPDKEYSFIRFYLKCSYSYRLQRKGICDCLPELCKTDRSKRELL